MGRNVAIVSGGGKQRIKFDIDAGGMHDLTIRAKRAETVPAFGRRDYWDWVGKSRRRVIQWQRPVPERLVGKPVETETMQADERQCVVPKPTLEHRA